MEEQKHRGRECTSCGQEVIKNMEDVTIPFVNSRDKRASEMMNGLLSLCIQIPFDHFF